MIQARCALGVVDGDDFPAVGLMPPKVREFSSLEQAQEWMHRQVDDLCDRLEIMSKVRKDQHDRREQRTSGLPPE